jgi:hypothetical protein
MRGSNMPTCHVCGKANPDDARYCFGCGVSLSYMQPVKVDVKSPLTPSMKPTPSAPTMAPSTYAPAQLQRQGSCYYHPELPSSFVCSRCGRPICTSCNRQYGVLSFCTECYWGLAPKLGSQPGQYAVGGEQQARSPFSPF